MVNEQRSQSGKEEHGSDLKSIRDEREKRREERSEQREEERGEGGEGRKVERKRGLAAFSVHPAKAALSVSCEDEVSAGVAAAHIPKRGSALLSRGFWTQISDLFHQHIYLTLPYAHTGVHAERSFHLCSGLEDKLSISSNISQSQAP